MAAITFDTLKFVQTLEDAGVDRQSGAGGGTFPETCRFCGGNSTRTQSPPAFRLCTPCASLRRSIYLRWNRSCCCRPPRESPRTEAMFHA